jgi:hypothetical protein
VLVAFLITGAKAVAARVEPDGRKLPIVVELNPISDGKWKTRRPRVDPPTPQCRGVTDYPLVV